MRDAWRRLRGGDLTPSRAALSVAVGVAVGVTPLYGLHWIIVLAICIPARLDSGVALLASNISLPFIAPFIVFAEAQLGARVLHGAWTTLSLEDARHVEPKKIVSEIAVGTVLVSFVSSIVAGALAWLAVALIRRKRRDAPARDAPAPDEPAPDEPEKL